MSEQVWCPRCGGPAKTVRDWRGDATIQCDAFAPCTEPTPLETLFERAERETEGFWDALGEESV